MYEKLLDLNVLYEAFCKCKKGVYWKDSVQKYESNLLINLYHLRKSLLDGTYKQKPFYEFDICERGKKRHIKALHISDRVLQRALCDEILMPNIRKYLIYDNGANVKGKGVDFARKRMITHLKRFHRKHKDGYILQMDISKYFDSIPHDKAYEIMTKHIDDERVKSLIKYLISTFDNGVGIGSQISQLIGAYYLHEFDNYIKIVKGVKFYARFSDDMYIIHYDKEYLGELLGDIKRKLSEYGLKLNENKTQIRKVNRKFHFLKTGFLLTKTGKVIVTPSKKTFILERRKLKAFRNKLRFIDIENQYKGWRGTVTPRKGIPFRSYRNIIRMDALFNLIKEEYYGKNDRRGKRKS